MSDLDGLEILPLPKNERKNPTVRIVTKQVYVVEYFDIYGRKKHKNKFTQHAVDVLVFKRQFANKYAPFDGLFYDGRDPEYGGGYVSYGPMAFDYQKMKERYFRFVKFLRRNIKKLEAKQ